MTAVTLVACAKRKVDRPVPARDLYASQWFRKARVWAERRGNPWFIVSALHGLLDPAQVVAPYERVLSEYDPRERLAWGRRVADQLVERLGAGPVDVALLAGELYAVPLMEALTGRYRFTRPMEGLGIGEQLGWLTRELRAGVPVSQQRGFF